LFSSLNTFATKRVGIALAALMLAAPVFAQSVGKSNASTTDELNPYSPRFGHPYRHGPVPTREAHANMKAWRAANAGPAVTTTTGPETLSFNGGVNGIGVTSGTPKVYLVVYGSQWGTAGTDSNGNMTLSGDAQGAIPYLQKLFKGMGTGGELWSGVMTQYCDGSSVSTGATSCPGGAPHIGYPTGGALAGIWYDNSAASPSQTTGNQLAQEAIRAAAHFGNTTAASNRYAQYVILSPSGTHPDGFGSASFCAWHDWTGDTTLSGGAANSPYGPIAFTNMPYVSDLGGSCGANFVSGALDGFSIVEGHEYAETLTDQLPAGGWINRTSSSYAGEETGDECAWISSGQGAAALVSMSTGSFAMQSTWSNDTNRCDISHSIVTGAGTPSASFTATPTGLSVAFTDTSTDTGGTLGSHTWNFGDTATSTAANPSHTYAAAGTYTVTETVSDAVSGAQSTASKSVTVAAGGTPVANFTDVVNGLSVAFTDASTDTGGSISSHSWTFGDGGTSTAASPSHTYASAGTYTVTETVQDGGNNATSTKSASVTVTNATQLIGNSGFETGSASPWSLTSGVLCSNSTCSGESAHTGSWFAWLNGYGKTSTDIASQTVTIPSGKTQATLSFYLHINTAETGTVAHDVLQVQVLNTSGTVLATLATYSNVNAASGYTQRTFNLASYIGKTITLRFYGTENNSLVTSFVLDDVTLTVQ
jgi:PKD repeat protein